MKERKGGMAGRGLGGFFLMRILPFRVSDQVAL